MTTRRRRNASKAEVEPTEPIDEQDQEEIIAYLEKKCIQDSKFSARVLLYLCCITAIVSLLSYFIHKSSDGLYFYYALYVAILHMLAARNSQFLMEYTQELERKSIQVAMDKTKTPYNFWLSTMLCIFPFVFHLIMVPTSDVWVWILSISNVFTFMAVHLTTNDCRRSFERLHELKGSTYRHKAL